MTVTVEFAPDHEFICEMSDEEKALVEKIKQANKEGKTTFSNDELSKEDVAMLADLMKRDVNAFSDQTKESFNQFRKEIRTDMDAFRNEARNDIDSLRQSSMSSIEEMRRSMKERQDSMSSRINSARSGGGNVSDFINAGFKDREETKQVMTEQRNQHDVAVVEATARALDGEWQTVEVHAPEEHRMDSEPVYAVQAPEERHMNSEPVYVVQPAEKSPLDGKKPANQPSVLDLKNMKQHVR